MLLSLAHIASVDAFQTWIYTSGQGGDAGGAGRGVAPDPEPLRARAWTGAGLEQERVARWYRQLHIFLYPFYYIEYGIAQIGALQVWRNSLRRSGRAPSPRYREALALGATRAAAGASTARPGARLTFDAGDDRRAGGSWWRARSTRSAPSCRGG